MAICHSVMMTAHLPGRNDRHTYGSLGLADATAATAMVEAQASTLMKSEQIACFG